LRITMAALTGPPQGPPLHIAEFVIVQTIDTNGGWTTVVGCLHFLLMSG
jgi:hypothetical protein